MKYHENIKFTSNRTRHVMYIVSINGNITL